MTRIDFEETQAALVQAGFTITESSFSDEAFGSWAVTVETQPAIRVVWDGKDGWLLIEVQTDQTFAGARVWNTISTYRDAKQQTPRQAVAAVRDARSRPTI